MAWKPKLILLCTKTSRLRAGPIGCGAVCLMIGIVALFQLPVLLPGKAGQTQKSAATQQGKPIALNPDNPHYFLFRGKPTVLITSTEHYGAVVNLDFDYIKYLDELHSWGFNLTRLFSGVYVEHCGAFNIEKNTLAPAPNRFTCPWARSRMPGYAGGGDKFDLHQWDKSYFRRLKDFISQAGQRGIVVEMVLFCPYYADQQWNLSPVKASNNIQRIGSASRTDALTLNNGDLLPVQDAMVRKIVNELKDFDNLYYEVCNEPYFGGVTLDWQRHIISTILDTEAPFPSKHLMAQNISNGSMKVNNPNPSISIFNFHYSRPPDSVAMNYDLNRVIADDETGFKGIGDTPYRREGWDFIVSGGGVYDNLDYSFTAGHEDGTFVFPSTQPGGGGPALRSQLKVLKDFIYGFDFIHMHPDDSVVHALNTDVTTHALVQPGKGYAIYIDGGSESTLMLDVPAGEYRAEWLNPRTGSVDKTQDVNHHGSSLMLASPAYSEDVAVRLVRRGK